METHFFVDTDGNYIGGFCGEAALLLVPEGAIEVSIAPNCAWYHWNGTSWEVV